MYSYNRIRIPPIVSFVNGFLEVLAIFFSEEGVRERNGGEMEEKGRRGGGEGGEKGKKEKLNVSVTGKVFSKGKGGKERRIQGEREKIKERGGNGEEMGRERREMEKMGRKLLVKSL